MMLNEALFCKSILEAFFSAKCYGSELSRQMASRAGGSRPVQSAALKDTLTTRI